MNKNNKILVGVLAFIVAMTIGYALFSDKITITGTAKAKGDFSAGVQCNPGISNELYNASLNFYSKMGASTEELNEFKKQIDWLIESESGYSNDTCVINNNNISLASNLNYPGANRNFSIKITNTGSIPFYLKNTNLLNSSISGTVTGTDGTVYDAADNLRTDVKQNLLGEPSLIAYDGTIDENFNPDDINSIVVKPGESIYFLYRLELMQDIGITNTKPIKAFDIVGSGTYELVLEQAIN